MAKTSRMARTAGALFATLAFVSVAAWWTMSGAKPATHDELPADPTPKSPAPEVHVAADARATLSLPAESVPSTRPHFVSSQHQYTDVSAADARGMATAPSGPKASIRARAQRGERITLADSRAATASNREIDALPQMRNLRALTLGLTDAHMVASYQGLSETEAVLAELAAGLRALGYDGEVDAEVVQEQACGIASGTRVCHLDTDTCIALSRLDHIATAVCSDPLAQLPDGLTQKAALEAK